MLTLVTHLLKIYFNLLLPYILLSLYNETKHYTITMLKTLIFLVYPVISMYYIFFVIHYFQAPEFASMFFTSCPKRVHFQRTVRPQLPPLSAAWTLPPSSHSQTLQPPTSTPRWRSNSRMRRRRAILAAAPKEGSSATLKQRKNL